MVHVVPKGDILLLQAEFRIVAITLIGYHYLSTMGAEWRFLFRQRQTGRYTLPFVLFVLVRYFSLIDMISSQISYFSGTGKSERACTIWIYEIRYVRLLASAVSSLILAWRAWVICLKSRRLAYFLAPFYCAVVIIPLWTESYINLFIGEKGECWAGNPHRVLGVIYYVVNLIFDAFLVFISTRRLWINAVTTGVMHAFSASLMKEGLWYFVVVTSFNVLNIILWSLPPATGAQTLGANMGVAINSMMAQGIILNLQEVTVPREQPNSTAGYASNKSQSHGSRWQPKTTEMPTSSAVGTGTGTDVRVDITSSSWAEEEEHKRARNAAPRYADHGISEKQTYASSEVELSSLPPPHGHGYSG